MLHRSRVGRRLCSKKTDCRGRDPACWVGGAGLLGWWPTGALAEASQLWWWGGSEMVRRQQERR